MNVNILLDSDQHYHYDSSLNKIIIGQNKGDSTLFKMLGEENISTVVLPGDFTDHGWDAKVFCCCIKNGEYDEFGTFMEDFFTPLKNKFGDVLTTVGNHSSYVAWPYTHKPEYDFVTSLHGNMYYSFRKDGIIYFSCGLYPSFEICEWLSTELRSNSLPIIIFFHYNLDGDYSDWWSDDEKQNFLSVVLPYKDRILSIFCGHLHSTKSYKWNDIQITMAAANSPALCSYDPISKNFSVRFL